MAFNVNQSQLNEEQIIQQVYNPLVSTSGGLTIDQGAFNTFQTSQQTVGVAAVQITPSPLANRSTVLIKLITTGPIYIGNSNSVTASNGFLLNENDTLSLKINVSQKIWIISGNSSDTVSIMEFS